MESLQKESEWEKQLKECEDDFIADIYGPEIAKERSSIGVRLSFQKHVSRLLSNREKEIAEEVEKMKKVCRTCKKPLDETARDWDGVANCQCCEHEKVAYEHSTEEIGYNQAITDVISILKH